MKTSVGFRILAFVAVVCAFGAGCGDNENVDVNLNQATSTPVTGRTPTPGAATATRTATTVEETATPAPTVSSSESTTPSESPSVNPSPSPSGSAAQVETASDTFVSFLTIAGLARGVGSSSSSSTAKSTAAAKVNREGSNASGTDDCPNGGTRTEVDSPSDALPLMITVTLDACQFMDPTLGSFQFDGTIVVDVVGGTATFDVSVMDLINDQTVMYNGTITGAPKSGGGFVVNGPITIMTPQGDFKLTANDVTVDSDGNVVSGSGTVEDTDDNFDLASIEVTIRTGGQLADVVATFDDNSTASFVLNLKTGELTPA